MNLNDILESENIEQSILNNLNNLIEIIPEIKHMINFNQKHPHHHLDLFNHTLLALSLSENKFDIRLVLLLHDIGKPFSFTDGDVRHFYNHAIVSSEMAKIILKRLKYNDDYIDYICYLIKNHDRTITDIQLDEDLDLAVMLFEIQKCDAMAHNPQKLEKRIKYINEIKAKILIKKNELIK